MAFVLHSESLLFPNFENCPSSKKGSLKRLVFGVVGRCERDRTSDPLLSEKVVILTKFD